MIIVITGGIASGKSFISQLFAKQGFSAINLDSMAHTLLEKGSAAYKKLVEAFPEALDQEGIINRKLLSDIAFNDIDKYHCLSRITHPILRSQYQEIINKTTDNIVIEIPLMIEAIVREQYEYVNDYIVLVRASYDTRLKRALERNGMTKEKFDAIVALQLPDSIKAQYADFIIDSENAQAALIQVRSIIHGKFNQ